MIHYQMNWRGKTSNSFQYVPAFSMWYQNMWKKNVSASHWVRSFLLLRDQSWHISSSSELELAGFSLALVFFYFTVNQEALPREAVEDVIICTYSETWGEKHEGYLSIAKAHWKFFFLQTKIPPHIKRGPPSASAVIRHLSTLLRKVSERDGLWDDIKLNSLLGCQYYFSFTCWLSHRTD